jgi:hypothetical protein
MAADLDTVRKERCREGATIKMLAAEFERTSGAVRSRLEKLGLVAL